MRDVLGLVESIKLLGTALKSPHVNNKPLQIVFNFFQYPFQEQRLLFVGGINVHNSICNVIQVTYKDYEPTQGVQNSFMELKRQSSLWQLEFLSF